MLVRDAIELLRQQDPNTTVYVNIDGDEDLLPIDDIEEVDGVVVIEVS